MAQAGNKMGHNPKRAQHGPKGGGSASEETLDEFDLAADLKGRNALQGDDQQNTPNERQSQAEADGDTDEVLESFRKTDKEYRARQEELKREGKLD
jgi:hypothetical protein